MDFFVKHEAENLKNLYQAISELGYEVSEDLVVAVESHEQIRFSDEYFTVEILFDLIIKTPFHQLYTRGHEDQLGKNKVKFIGLEDLIDEKAKSQRWKDLNDIRELKKLNN